MRYVLAAALLALGACETGPYYSALEAIGIEKRDLLVDRVDDSRASQKQAQAAFTDALTAYRRTVNVDAPRLEAQYDRYAAAYDNAKDKAEAVKSDIESVRRVSADLFAEWERELGQYQDETLRAQSQAQLDATRARYAELETKLLASAARMDPVLLMFRDQVLFLKHNLNARAIASLQGKEARISADVDTLIAEMNQSIEAATRFIAEMKAGA